MTRSGPARSWRKRRSSVASRRGRVAPPFASTNASTASAGSRSSGVTLKGGRSRRSFASTPGARSVRTPAVSSSPARAGAAVRRCPRRRSRSCPSSSRGGALTAGALDFLQDDLDILGRRLAGVPVDVEPHHKLGGIARGVPPRTGACVEGARWLTTAERTRVPAGGAASCGPRILKHAKEFFRYEISSPCTRAPSAWEIGPPLSRYRAGLEPSSGRNGSDTVREESSSKHPPT